MSKKRYFLGEISKIIVSNNIEELAFQKLKKGYPQTIIAKDSMGKLQPPNFFSVDLSSSSTEKDFFEIVKAVGRADFQKIVEKIEKKNIEEYEFIMLKKLLQENIEKHKESVQIFHDSRKKELKTIKDIQEIEYIESFDENNWIQNITYLDIQKKNYKQTTNYNNENSSFSSDNYCLAG